MQQLFFEAFPGGWFFLNMVCLFRTNMNKLCCMKKGFVVIAVARTAVARTAVAHTAVVFLFIHPLLKMPRVEGEPGIL